MTASKITGASQVGTLRAPSRRSARSAARRPTLSAGSSPSQRRDDENHASRCMPDSPFASDSATSEWRADAYSPTKPALLP